MERKQALEALLVKVEAGNAREIDEGWLHLPCTTHDDGSMSSHMGKGWRAYHGSLDAAKALHDALLPGWLVEIEIDDDGVWDVCIPWKADPEQCNSEWAQGDNPARAWLCAIIKALIAKGVK